VLELVASGLNDCQISRQTGIPRRTVLDWRHGSRRRGQARAYGASPFPPPSQEYAYLLGIYLGDGCLSRTGRPGVWRLRIFNDVRYPNIIAEICAAMEAIFPAKRAHRLQRRDSACVEISMYSKHWIRLFPQHGPGRKHLRRIELADWQQEIVCDDHRPFLRGLIHSDGCRFIATERQSGRVRRAPRYVFTNQSEEIKQLFCESCDAVGVRWTRPNPKSVAVYRLESVARLDEFVGPKR
jgi:hypothetical protein